MKGKTFRNYILQAAVCLVLLLSTIVGAVQPTKITQYPESTQIQTSMVLGDEPTIEVSVSLPQVIVGTTSVNGNEYTTIQLPEEGFTTALGEAQLPLINRFIELPAGATPQLHIVAVEWQTTSLALLGASAPVIPVQPSLMKIEGASVDFMFDSSYYSTNQMNPVVYAQIRDLGAIRSRHVALLSVSPVMYNPVTGELRIMTSCTLRVELPGSDLLQTETLTQRYYSPAFEASFQQMFTNYGVFEHTIEPKTSEGYLIIVYDQFYDNILPLQSWKESKGFDCTVTRTTEIPGGATKENIKAYIVDAYNNWPVPPAYVLLVGDVAQVPAWTGEDTGTCTDLYYVTIDAGNYFADLIISRFPAASPANVDAMVDKTIFYEAGVFDNDSWIKKAVFMASEDNWDVSEGTHNYVIDTHLVPHNYTCDKRYSHTYDATTQQVRDSLNNGRSLAIYSGHGGTDYWADGPVFHQSDVNGLTNDGMYPFVCSHACITGTYSYGECFGETWLRAPNKGGLAFWGASESTYWDEDDILERRTFDAWWNDNIETIGGMTNMGLYYLYQYYSGGGMSQYYFEAYNVLGDSSVKIWRGESNTNTPPATPGQPQGPATGEIGIEYTFTTSTTDAQGDDIFYMVSWGDTVSDWLGPYASGETVGLSHTWAIVGDYTIKVKAKDSSEGLESDWSAVATISILALPRIEIGEITGGFGISAVIENVGAGEATDITWSISIQSGIVLLGRETSGTFTKILPGFGPTVKTKFVLGFGSVDITVTAGDVEKTVTARLIGPFFLNVQ